jgi:hypothetical protein
LLPVLIPTVAAVVSWFVGSWLAARRDRANKRREIRIHYLVEAYRRLATAAEPPETNAAYLRDLDSAIVDIQLFGSANQIVSAQRFGRQLAEQWVGQVHELLSSLRDDLRKELKLQRVEGPIVVLRATFDEKRRNDQPLNPWLRVCRLSAEG